MFYHSNNIKLQNRLQRCGRIKRLTYYVFSSIVQHQLEECKPRLDPPLDYVDNQVLFISLLCALGLQGK